MPARNRPITAPLRTLNIRERTVSTTAEVDRLHFRSEWRFDHLPTVDDIDVDPNNDKWGIQPEVSLSRWHVRHQPIIWGAVSRQNQDISVHSVYCFQNELQTIELTI